MKINKLLVPIFATSLLFACSKSGGGSDKEDAANEAPVINWILADVIDYDQGYLIANGSSNTDYSLAHLVTLNVDDPDGQDDIVDIRFTNSSDELYILKSETSNAYWNESTELYSRSSFSFTNLHSITLAGWTMTVTDSAGNVVTQDFGFVLPNLATPATGETFLYTSGYSGVTTGGVSALVSPTLAATSTKANISTGITIKYTPTDTRIKGYKLYFYNSTNDLVAYTGIDWSTPTTETKDVENDYLVNNNMLTYIDGYSYSDIAKFSWQSVDDKTGAIAVDSTISTWWRHEAHSNVVAF